MARKLTFPEFKARCQFYMRGNHLHGVVRVKLPSGRIVEFRTQANEGIDLNLLASKLLKRQGPAVSGFFGDAWKAAKGAASSVASNKLTKTLYSKTRQALENPYVQTALSQVPGGSQVKLGMQAADLLEKALIKRDPLARRKVKNIALRAAKGYPNARKADAIIRAIYKVGKEKGAWLPRVPTPRPRYGIPGLSAWPGGKVSGDLRAFHHDIVGAGEWQDIVGAVKWGGKVNFYKLGLGR